MRLSTTRIAVIAAVLAVAFVSGTAQAQTKVADVIALKCTTFVTSGGKTQALAIGGPIY